MEMKCECCGKVFDISIWSKTQRSALRKGTRPPHCSMECARKTAKTKTVWTEERREQSRQFMADWNRKHCSQRMKEDNPMHNESTRQKVSKTLKEMGHRPAVQGGNGRGMTTPQSLMVAHLLQFHPYPEYVIPTGRRPEGYPIHYKIDIAIPDKMVAIEIDGGSHCSLKVQIADMRKTEFLTELGWKVLRFSNREVMEHLEDCVEMVKSTISA